MITKFKIYEQIKEEPRVGDYVVVNNNTLRFIGLGQHTGKICNVTSSNTGNVKNGAIYQIEIDPKLGSWWFDSEDIVAYSKNKKDLEIYIDTNKYNL